MTAKDLANIRTLIQQECLQANKETRRKLVKLEKEIRHLREDNKIILSWWNPIDEYVRQHPDLKIGTSVSRTALQFIRERDEYVVMSKSWKDNYEKLLILYNELSEDLNNKTSDNKGQHDGNRT